jgi:hypothetical protein
MKRMLIALKYYWLQMPHFPSSALRAGSLSVTFGVCHFFLVAKRVLLVVSE